MTDSSLEGPTQDSPRGDVSLDRLKVWIGLSKFVIGTLAVGVLTTVLDCSYRNAQLKLQEKQSASALALQEKQAEFDYLSKFIEHAMDEDLRVRIRLASYMTSVALSDNIKGIWERYHAELLRQANDFDARLDVLERQETEKVVLLRQTPSAAQEARQELIREIDAIRREIYYVRDQLDRKKYGEFEENYVDIPALLREADEAHALQLYQKEVELLESALRRAPDSLRYAVISELVRAHRALRQFDQARLYSARLVELLPDEPITLSNHAIMQKNAGQLDDALRTLSRAASLASGDTLLNVQLMTAGYLIHAQRRSEGEAVFREIRLQVESSRGLATNLAWYLAVAGPEDEFYAALERALQQSPGRTRDWMRIEVDLQKYRGQQRFQELESRYQ